MSGKPRRYDLYLLNCLHWVLLRPGKAAAMCPDCQEVKPVIHTIERWRA